MRQVTDLREMQTLALIILKGIKEFCTEKHIDYYLAYGTLLGAIRHKGFIPWDDDIDLWMKRNDFNIFCDQFPAWGREHGLYLNSVRTVPNYNRVQAKVCLSNTELKENDRINPYEEGYFVDIFPLDGTPNNRYKRWIHLKKLQMLKNVVTLSAYNREGNAVISLIAKIFRNVNTHKVLTHYEKLAGNYSCDGADLFKVIAPGSKKGRDILIQSLLFRDSQTVPFEELYAKVPDGYENILRDIYGDFMRLPPESERKPHHDFTLWIED